MSLARTGARVAVNYRTHVAGGQAIAVQANVPISNEVVEMVRQVESQLGPVAVLVNNAGITRPQPIHEITEQD